MDGFERSPWTTWLQATALALVVGIVVLYLPLAPSLKAKVSLYFAPGYWLYREVLGQDFDGGSSVAQYACVLGGTAAGWGSFATLLWWLKAKFDSAIAYVAFVGFVVAAVVFVFAAARLFPS